MPVLWKQPAAPLPSSTVGMTVSITATRGALLNLGKGCKDTPCPSCLTARRAVGMACRFRGVRRAPRTFLLHGSPGTGKVSRQATLAIPTHPPTHPGLLPCPLPCPNPPSSPADTGG
jgi:hypothetical protein